MLTKAQILLRPIKETDIIQIAKLCNDKSIHDMVLNIPYPYSESDARFFYEKIVKKEETEKTCLHYAISEANSDLMIGTIALHFDSRKPFMAMAGYWLGAEYRRRGYMTEALKLLIEIGFEDYKLKRIYATHKPGNDISAKVMLNAGMEYEGTLRANLYYKGEYQDSPMYTIINVEI